jgi:FkbM family methyltransferase
MSSFFAAAARKLLFSERDRRDLLESLFWHLPRITCSRLHENGFRPAGIIDIGACRGDWSRMIGDIFPGVPILLVEARSEESQNLAVVCAELPQAEYTIALLGPEARDSAVFHNCSSGSSRFRERSNIPQSSSQMPMRRLDDIILPKHKLRPPLFIKLDLQGGELDVLRGGSDAISRAEVIQIEVALLPYNDGAPTAAEVVRFMDDQGFAIYDIAGFVRPNGADLVQIDIVFAAKTSKLRRDFFHFNQYAGQSL